MAAGPAAAPTHGGPGQASFLPEPRFSPLENRHIGTCFVRCAGKSSLPVIVAVIFGTVQTPGSSQTPPRLQGRRECPLFQMRGKPPPEPRPPRGSVGPQQGRRRGWALSPAPSRSPPASPLRSRHTSPQTVGPEPGRAGEEHRVAVLPAKTRVELVTGSDGTALAHPAQCGCACCRHPRRAPLRRTRPRRGTAAALTGTLVGLLCGRGR